MNSGNKYKIIISKQAKKDSKLIIAAKLIDKVQVLLEDLEEDPYNPNNHYEKLSHDLNGLHSKRINIKHRLVYEVFDESHEIIVHRMWSYYDRMK